MSGQQQGQGNPDAGMGLILGFVLIIAAFAGVWHFAHASIVTALFWLWRGEIFLLGFVTSRLDSLSVWMATEDLSTVTWSQVSYVANNIGSYTRWGVAAVLLAMGLRLRDLSPEKKFRRNLSMESLIRLQVKAWPAIAPIVDDNPITEDGAWFKAAKAVGDAKKKCEAARAAGDKAAYKALHAALRKAEAALQSKFPKGQRRWGPPLHPHEWMTANNLIGEDQQAIESALARQLTTPWQGVAALPVTLQAIYAACVLKAKGEKNKKGKDAAAELLGDLSNLWAASGRHIGMDEAIRRHPRQFTQSPSRIAATVLAAALLVLAFEGKAAWKRLSGLWRKEPPIAERIKKIIADTGDEAAEAAMKASQHAYVETALLSVYKWAKDRGGVMPTSEFLWLRLANRPLFYILNCEGRNTPFPECSGVYAHHLAELALGRPLATPVIEEAVVGVLEGIGR